MITPARLNELNKNIIRIKQLLTDLQEQADEFPALFRNVKRISASIKMLELNISDIVDLTENHPDRDS